MAQPLFTLPLRNKRDTMVARQRTRQLAGLLGYDIQEQAGIAAGVFAVAWQILSMRSPVQLSFLIDNDALKVLAQARRPDSDRSVLVLERPLPGRGKICFDDLTWAIDKLDQITPAHMYEEVYRLNQELLATMQALQTCQAQLAPWARRKKPAPPERFIVSREGTNRFSAPRPPGSA